MSTRGIFGFVIDGKVKASYNHSDSYPSWLGKHMAQSILSLREDKEIKDKVRGIMMVNSHSQEPKDVWERLCKDRGSDDFEDMYDILHENQGDLVVSLKNGVMTDDADFGKDSLFCEWGYLWNLDENTLEIYKGFQRTNKGGRFEVKKPDEEGYYGIALIKTIPVDEDIMKEMEAFIKKHD